MSTMNHSTDYLVNHTCARLPLDETADPDITGLGVVISFMISITFNLFAIIVAYFCRWLPEDRYSPIDDAFARTIQSFVTCLSIPGRQSSQQSDNQNPGRILSKKKRIRAFESFMLAMSDQQLITGVALIITTTFMTFKDSLSETFSVYSFQIATRLGYFSCIVHLCTISLLREHFDTNKRSRNFRAVLVAILLVLLIICMVISDSVTFRFNRHISVRCAREHFSFVDSNRPGYVWFSDEVVVVFNLVVLILVILLGYSRRFLELYNTHARTEYHYWPRKSLSVLFGKEYEDAYNKVSPGIVSSLETLGDSGFSDEHREVTFKDWVLVTEIWIETISTSLLWDIIWLSFYFTFGMGSFWNFYMDADVKPNMEPNFGQVVPLILVCLPFLAAWEAFSATLATDSPFSGPNPRNSHTASDVTQQDGFPPPPTAVVLSCCCCSGLGSRDTSGSPNRGDGDTEPLMAIQTGNEEDMGDFLRVANDLEIPLKWFQICTILYWFGLMVWALMFAGVIPGHGAFYVSIMACIIFAGFAMASAAAWFKAIYLVIFENFSLTNLCTRLLGWFQS